MKMCYFTVAGYGHGWPSSRLTRLSGGRPAAANLSIPQPSPCHNIQVPEPANEVLCVTGICKFAATDRLAGSRIDQQENLAVTRSDLHGKQPATIARSEGLVGREAAHDEI